MRSDRDYATRVDKGLDDSEQPRPPLDYFADQEDARVERDAEHLAVFVVGCVVGATLLAVCKGWF